MNSVLELSKFPWASGSKVDSGLLQWRQDHWQKFLKQGLPTRRLESWHYTDLQKWLKTLSRAADGDADMPAPPLDNHEYHVLFINGVYKPGLSSLPSGVEVLNWQGLLSSTKNPVELMNRFSANFETLQNELGGLAEFHQGLFGDGYTIRVKANTKLRSPLHIVYSWQDQPQASVAAHTNWIRLEPGAEATVVEWYRGTENLVTSTWTVADLEESSRLQLVRAQTHRPTAVHLGLVLANLSARSNFKGYLLDRGGSLSRETWAISHLSAAAESEIEGLQLGEGTAHMDLRTVIQHQQPKGKSSQRARALLAGPCRTVFNGKIVIAKDAQEVAAQQLSQNILLHPSAEANAKPELEIYADNVKANHGASVGQLSEGELFYLQSRGLTAASAQRMLAEGFARDSVSSMEDAGLRRQLESWIQVQVDTLLSQRGVL